MSKKQSGILLASLDLFWLPEIYRALRQEHELFLVSTWSLFKEKQGWNSLNLLPLHCMLWLFKRFPFMQRGNHLYFWMVCFFDWALSCLSPGRFAVLCVLSGCGLKSLRRFKKKDRQVIIECGSTHTDYQHRILDQEFKRNGLELPLFPRGYRNRVRNEFLEADWIQIPSQFVQKTFLEAGIPASKLLLNPYGADTRRFSPRKKDDLDRNFRVLCPSGVNLRKGARVLVEAWKRLDWKDAELHWIGSPGPQTRHLFQGELRGLHWHGWMTQQNLANVYRDSDVLVLPSFEEGFARVMVEGAPADLR
ncbi:MAG: glycosyltransferase family 4 protein [Blastochloris sp.]|nr:glycosyltransferase family 4 protein [Blastochloris sp.]